MDIIGLFSPNISAACMRMNSQKNKIKENCQSDLGFVLVSQQAKLVSGIRRMICNCCVSPESELWLQSQQPRKNNSEGFSYLLIFHKTKLEYGASHKKKTSTLVEGLHGVIWLLSGSKDQIKLNNKELFKRRTVA